MKWRIWSIAFNDMWVVFNSHEAFGSGIKLSVLLAGRTGTQVADQKLKSSMASLSFPVIKQILQAARQGRISIVEIPISGLNQVSTLLGDLQNLKDLGVSFTPIEFPCTHNYTDNLHRVNSHNPLACSSHPIFLVSQHNRLPRSPPRGNTVRS